VAVEEEEEEEEEVEEEEISLEVVNKILSLICLL
jgi:hypothetical protein